MTRLSSSAAFRTSLLLAVAGLGGLLYGIDVGIISAALLYLGKTVDLTLGQSSVLVAAVLGGSMVSSLFAGFLADLVGRKKMMICSALLFVLSVAFIVLSQGFVSLLIGRILQGLSGGVIAVVVPLHLAETLPANTRGRGSAIFQFMLTLGIVAAAGIGVYFSSGAEHAIAAAHGNALLVRAANDHAWRGMFLAVIYPGLLFLLGSFFVSESPRWLFRKHRREQALHVLRQMLTPAEAERELREMETVTGQTATQNAPRDPLLQRKYIVPFILACVILACNQATGINSILGYLSVILKQAGMSAVQATRGDFAVKALNCAMTVAAVLLVDRKGRKFLLMGGTAVVVIALAMAGIVFHQFEAGRVDVLDATRALQKGNELTIPPDTVQQRFGNPTLTVLYNYGDGTRIVTAGATDPAPLHIAPDAAKPNAELHLEKAFVTPQSSPQVARLIAISLAIFIAGYSIGPGVVVWLALSELMPTRIRSSGMGIALLLNQGVSTLIAGLFLPVVSSHGYSTMFFFWAGCTVVYFLTATFALPETKGRTLEEIEALFARPAKRRATHG